MVTIFTLAEARAFPYQGQVPLADDTAYPDEMITDAAERITEDFARICDVSFVPVVGATATLDGNGAPYLLLNRAKVTAVTAVEHWDGTAWVDAGLGYRVLDDGALLGQTRWPWGRANLRVTYTHGYAEPPPAIKRAALILAVEELAGSNISARATQQTDANGTFNLSVPGWRDNQWTGVPDVDSTLQRYSARTPMAVG